jgi:uncharacterized cupin superfamily protein
MSDNIWTTELENGEDWSGGGAHAHWLPRGDNLGATVWELGPGNWSPFHFHHAAEEMLVVLRGGPTVRTSEGSRQLEPGDVLHFPTGPDGAHGISNETGEPVRYLMVSTRPSPEVAEYPDLKKITVQARARSQTGEQLWFIHDVETREGA